MNHTTEWIAEHAISAPRADLLLWCVEKELEGQPAASLYRVIADAVEFENPHRLLTAYDLAVHLTGSSGDARAAVRLGNLAESLEYSAHLRAMTDAQFAEDYPNAVRGRSAESARCVRLRRADTYHVTARHAARSYTDEQAMLADDDMIGCG